MRLLAAALVVGVLGPALIVGCGGSGKAYEGAPAKMARPPQEWPTTPEAAHTRIETLDREIADGAAILGLDAIEAGVDPGGADVSPMTEPAGAGTSAGGGDRCARSSRPVCQDVCTLADSICAAADEICQLAAQLPGDDWAAGRCTAGRSSCAKARGRCCGC